MSHAEQIEEDELERRVGVGEWKSNDHVEQVERVEERVRVRGGCDVKLVFRKRKLITLVHLPTFRTLKPISLSSTASRQLRVSNTSAGLRMESYILRQSSDG